MEKTPSQKAAETRQKHRESQKRKEAEKRELTAKLKAGLLSVVEDDTAKPAEKLEASRLLMELTGERSYTRNGADAMRRRRAEEDPRAEQIVAISSLPCIMLWSDGSKTETTLAQAFTTEEDYSRYKKYKRSGKAYPVRIEAPELTEAELKEPSTIFPPPETRSGEYEVLKTMCEGFTRALEQFVEREG